MYAHLLFQSLSAFSETDGGMLKWRYVLYRLLYVGEMVEG